MDFHIDAIYTSICRYHRRGASRKNRYRFVSFCLYSLEVYRMHYSQNKSIILPESITLMSSSILKKINKSTFKSKFDTFDVHHLLATSYCSNSNQIHLMNTLSEKRLKIQTMPPYQYKECLLDINFHLTMFHVTLLISLNTHNLLHFHCLDILFLLLF